jgi:hypothetical protein
MAVDAECFTNVYSQIGWIPSLLDEVILRSAEIDPIVIGSDAIWVRKKNIPAILVPIQRFSTSCIAHVAKSDAGKLLLEVIDHALNLTKSLLELTIHHLSTTLAYRGTVSCSQRAAMKATNCFGLKSGSGLNIYIHDV